MARRSRMNSNRDDEPLNPYAVPASTQAWNANSGTRPVVVPFSGQVEFSNLRDLYWEPYRFASVLLALIVVEIVWGLLFTITFGWPATVASLILVTAIAALVGRSTLSAHRARLCVQRRPWLLGPVHGTVSGSRLTAWYGDVGVQSVRTILERPNWTRHIVVRLGKYPIVFIPTKCFYEEDWFNVHASTAGLTWVPPIVPSPPPDAFVCSVAGSRIGQLTDRRNGYHWRPTAFGIFSSVVIVLFVAMFSSLTMEPILYLIAIPFLAVLIEIVRFLLLTNSLRRQFASTNPNAYRPKVSSEFVVTSWFNRDHVLCAGESGWIQTPMHRISRARVDESGIEFYLNDLSLVLHREGFANESEWESACQMATEQCSHPPPGRVEQSEGRGVRSES